MTHSLEVGSIIGGRYRVTDLVVSTAEGDDVLSGLDQVLNRSVSILIASKRNASQAAQSGRELATGERQSTIQVLDMVITDGRPALVTNRASAHDLLDLLVSQDTPYIEPFSTESLGSEIFGQKREAVPEEDVEWDENYYDTQDEKPVFDFSSMSERARARAAERAAARDAAAAQKAEAARQKQSPRESEPPATQAQATAPATAPVSRQPRSSVRPLGPEPVEPASDGAAPSHHVPAHQTPGSTGSASGENRARALALGSGSSAAQPRTAADLEDISSHDEGDDDEVGDSRRGRTASRALVGVLLGALLVAAVVLAVTQLGSLFRDGGFAGGRNQASGESSASPRPSASSASPSAAAPQIAAIQRLVPGNPTLDAASDVNLPRIIDGNPSSSWGSLVYTNPQFGNLTQNFALVFELKSPAEAKRFQVTQQYGSGGQFQVLVNDAPSLDGATPVGQGTFSSQTVNVDLKTAGAKKYVLMNVTSLPRLSGVRTVYPWGMVIAEVRVS